MGNVVEKYAIKNNNSYKEERLMENYQEAIRSVPCFDKEILTVGSCVHVLEMDAETEEIHEIFGIIKNVELDEIVILYFDNRKSIDAMKHKRIGIDAVMDKSCSIEVLHPVKKKDRIHQLNQAKQEEHALKKIPFPHLSF